MQKEIVPPEESGTMVRYKIVVTLILALCSAALVCSASSTDVALEQLANTAHLGPLDSPAAEAADLLLDLTAEFTYSTYFGGSGSESYLHIVADSDGNIWVTGGTESDNLYTSPDAYNRTYGGSTDIFVIKLDGENGSILYSTYIGGSGYELPMSIEIDSEDNVWICGETGSSDLPTTQNAYNSTLNGLVDMFILKLSGSNGSLLYSSYVGGSGVESALSIDFDGGGNVWATGLTDSGDFPMSPSSLYPAYNGSFDAVLFQLSKNGTTLMYSTFFGGTDDDRGYEVLVDSSDDVWLAGTTNSLIFPVTPNAYKNTTSGGRDMYLLKLAGDGSTLLYSSFFGGSGTEDVMSIAFDAFGNIWGTGSTTSGGSGVGGRFSITSFSSEEATTVSSFSLQTTAVYYTRHIWAGQTKITGGPYRSIETTLFGSPAIRVQTHFPRRLTLSMTRLVEFEMPFCFHLHPMALNSTTQPSLVVLTWKCLRP